MPSCFSYLSRKCSASWSIQGPEHESMRSKRRPIWYSVKLTALGAPPKPSQLWVLASASLGVPASFARVANATELFNDVRQRLKKTGHIASKCARCLSPKRSTHTCNAFRFLPASNVRFLLDPLLPLHANRIFLASLRGKNAHGLHCSLAG